MGKGGQGSQHGKGGGSGEGGTRFTAWEGTAGGEGLRRGQLGGEVRGGVGRGREGDRDQGGQGSRGMDQGGQGSESCAVTCVGGREAGKGELS